MKVMKTSHGSRSRSTKLLWMTIAAITPRTMTEAWSLSSSSSSSLTSSFLGCGRACLYLPSHSSTTTTTTGTTRRSRRQTSRRCLGPWTMYNDPTSSSSAAAGGENSLHNAWSVLANTEQWISSTLAHSSSSSSGNNNSNNNNNAMDSAATLPSAAASNNNNNNPYVRKEVSYVCENQSATSMVVAGIFRRLKEAREMGQAHGQAERERSHTQGNAYKPSTMRQTQVIVIPSAPEFTESFLVFDSLVTTLNQARRNARDYITDSMLDDQEDDDEDDDDENQWSVAINLAHLHPLYGQRTPAQQVQDFRDEEAAGEVDVHLQEYKRLRLAARRSPYPTIVIEVRASPTPNFGTTTPSSSSSATNRPSSSSGNGVSLSDIQKLEALFGKTAHMKDSSSQDDAFWDAVGRSMKEITSVTPVKLAQQWIANHHDAATTLSAEEEAASTIVAFTTSSTAHVDEAYEFVFTNIAMLQEQYGVADASTDNNNNNDKSNHQQQQQYLVLPHFLSAAATSFENFSNEVTQLVACLPSLKGKLTVTTYHPEHIQANRRSPTPILALTWNNNHHHNKNNTSSS